MPGLLDGKRLLITGVITDSSIAFEVAKYAAEQGAQVILTGFGRMSLVERLAKRLGPDVPVIELDVTDAGQLATLADRVRERAAFADGLDGVLHAVAYAPPTCLGGEFSQAPWEDVSTAVHVSTYSFNALVAACLPLLGPGSSVVGLGFDAQVAWPTYNWMGVAKAGLEAVVRYLARELGPKGIRVNLVNSGPLRTKAAVSIPGFAQLKADWDTHAPLGWDPHDARPVATSVCALFSDLLPATTASVLMVDGGVHAMGLAMGA
ncbi:enoyl-ACP reductase FabI [Actinokineospora diospyrosa]|uniref:Enoyl-[acyl-carrier-protein] reductase [NADH] n=1 Tax=Actinokineospora diospyrosa TaxID=103728 RepID=A0ABT1IM48_9PSEU|nr:enoyl-ACP reductase FabI [Actinokineospora diospyrosa]MCP2273727.1 Enoyl-[acyl-carrier-protein] reductase [NADH] [Actinokineospora diospyrosa]